MVQPDGSYPVQFSVDYPDRELNRLTAAFRIIWIIPIAIVLAFVAGAGSGNYNATWGVADAATDVAVDGAGFGSGLLFIPVLLMILFRQKYPRWWFDWNLQLMRFGARVGAYLVLLRDETPQQTKSRPSALTSPTPMQRRASTAGSFWSSGSSRYRT